MRTALTSVLALAFSLFASCGSPAGRDAAYAGGERRPVVIELFSSEGCSSCPPADRVALDLAKTQPVPGAEVIALELHVDYWNQLGWEDPFSSSVYTARQRAYATTFGQRGVYTPQLVVDGRAELVGSNASGARNAIAAAAKAQKAKVQIDRRGDAFAISVGELPDASEAATVWLAVSESGLETAVPRGENAGATLAHGPIVRRLQKLGTIAPGTKGPAFHGTVPIAFEPSWKRDNLNAVVFVQRDRSLQIIGAGAASWSPPSAAR